MAVLQEEQVVGNDVAKGLPLSEAEPLVPADGEIRPAARSLGE